MLYTIIVSAKYKYIAFKILATNMSIYKKLHDTSVFTC